MQNLYLLRKGYFILSRKLSRDNLTLDKMRKLVKEAQDGILEDENKVAAALCFIY